MSSIKKNREERKAEVERLLNSAGYTACGAEVITVADKRFTAVCAAMQAIIGKLPTGNYNVHEVAKAAIAQGDALIAALAEKEGDK